MVKYRMYRRIFTCADPGAARENYLLVADLFVPVEAREDIRLPKEFKNISCDFFVPK
jgi:hypothetical protein